MSPRLHTTLVYFGFSDDPAEEARLNAAPINLWRGAAVAAAVLLVSVFAILLLMAGGVGTVPRAIAWLAVLVAVGVIVGRAIHQRRT